MHTENFQPLGGCEGKGLAGFDRVFFFEWTMEEKNRQMMGPFWVGSSLNVYGDFEGAIFKDCSVWYLNDP